MKFLHTPGPWEACDQGDYSDFDGNSRVILGDDIRIAVVQWSPGNADMDDANARLIAAAPDMLDALKIAIEVMDAVDGENDCSRGIGAAESAIAKATGESA